MGPVIALIMPIAEMTEWEQVYHAFLEARPVLLFAAAIWFLPLLDQ